MLQVVGVKSVAPAYGEIAPKDVEGKVADDDPLGIESAFATSGPGCADVSTIEDPIGLEAAFDVVFPCPGGDASNTLSERSVVSRVVSDEDVGSESDRDVSDIDSNPGEDDAQPGRVSVSARRMRRSPNFSRVGNKVMWGTAHIGSITNWGNNVSCHCRIHQRCRAPACTHWGSDRTLEQWLLEAIDVNGVERIDRVSHQTSIAAVRALTRPVRS